MSGQCQESLNKISDCKYEPFTCQGGNKRRIDTSAVEYEKIEKKSLQSWEKEKDLPRDEP